MKRAQLFAVLTCISFAVTGECRFVIAQSTPDNTRTDGSSATQNGDILTTELTTFLNATSESQEVQALERVIKLAPEFNDLATALRRALQSGRATDLKAGISHGHVFQIAGVELSASVHLPRQMESSVPLWVIPAHPTNKLNDDQTFQLILRALPKESIVMLVNLYNETFQNPNGAAAAKFKSGVTDNRQRIIDHSDVFATAVAMALRKFPVDPNRIYCWGVSASGNAAWWNGVCLPDLFAGIVACDTNPSFVVPRMGSLRQMRVAILHGELDDRCPVTVPRVVERILRELNVETNYLEVEGAGHGRSWVQKSPELCAWAERGVRSVSPKSLTYFPDRAGDRCFWIEALSLDIEEPSKRPAWGMPPAMISASMGDGNIDVTTRGVSRIRIWLMDNSIAIRVNEHVVEGEPAVRMGEALRHVKSRRDPSLFWSWCVDANVQVTENTSPN